MEEATLAEGEASTTAGEAGAEIGADWRAGIEEQRVRAFAERFASPAELARAAFGFRQKLSKALIPPGKDASTDEVRAFRRGIGVPDAPDGYGIALPAEAGAGEAERQRLDRFLAAMHAAGAPAPAVQAAYQAYVGVVEEAHASASRRAETAREVAAGELAREWGPDTARNVAMAGRAAAEFGGTRFAELCERAEVDGVALGDHPEFIRAFAAIGARMAEDGFHAGAGEALGASAEGRIGALMALMHSDPERYRSDAVQREIRDLHEELYGTAPIVGSDGRKA